MLQHCTCLTVHMCVLTLWRCVSLQLLAGTRMGPAEFPCVQGTAAPTVYPPPSCEVGAATAGQCISGSLAGGVATQAPCAREPQSSNWAGRRRWQLQSHVPLGCTVGVCGDMGSGKVLRASHACVVLATQIIYMPYAVLSSLLLCTWWLGTQE